MRPCTLLGLDVDETLVIGPGQVFAQTLHLHDIVYNRDVYGETRNWEKATGVPKEILTLLYEAFMHSEHCPVSEPIPGAHDFLAKFSEEAFILITARGPDTKDKTLAELRSHFGRSFTRSHFGCLGSKATVMHEQGVAILIDDSDHEAHRVVAALDHVFVIKFPHYYFDAHYPRPQHAHRRVIRLKAHEELRPNMPHDVLMEVLKDAWEEAARRVFELAAVNWPYLLENNKQHEACR